MQNETERNKNEYMKIPHNGSELTFISPGICTEDYAYAAIECGKGTCILPTMAETISLLFTAFERKNEPGFKDVISAYTGGHLWTSTAISYEPGDGIYIQDYPRIHVNKWNHLYTYTNRKTLIKKYKSGDKTVRRIMIPDNPGMPVLNFQEQDKLPFLNTLMGEDSVKKFIGFNPGGLEKVLISSYNRKGKFFLPTFIGKGPFFQIGENTLLGTEYITSDGFWIASQCSPGYIFKRFKN